MKHAAQYTPEERSLMAERAGRGLASIVDILREEHDLCPKCAIDLLLSSLEYIVSQQTEADNSTIN